MQPSPRGESSVALPKHHPIGGAVAAVVFAVGIFAVLVGLMATVYGVKVFNVSEMLVGVYSLMIGTVCLWLGYRMHKAAERRERRRPIETRYERPLRRATEMRSR
jgi:threonine/homoserine/homoserine lactone efflux protein